MKKSQILKWALFCVLVFNISAFAEEVDPGSRVERGGIVSARDGKFWMNGQPYYFVGTNFWQGMNLGSAGEKGNRERLVRELDRMQDLGIRNLRVMASSEGPNSEPFRMVPALMEEPGKYNTDVLEGLDFLLAEMAKREMKAVMVLGNYWQWSGGFAQYVSWDSGEPIPYPGNWSTFMSFSGRFYSCEKCQIWYRSHIEAIVNRVNVFSKIEYKNDPAIFSWELANEPRRYTQEWIDSTSGFIKSLDPNHMVTTGSEGTPPGERMDYAATHSSPTIDYGTIHIWPQNWGWFRPSSPSSYETSEQLAVDYFNQHVELSKQINKPMVLEEFGLARDEATTGDIYDPISTTVYRDLFYKKLFATTVASENVGGANFWAWGGEARPGQDWVGDPPHETPGWYSVFDKDETTLEVILQFYADIVAKISGK